MLKRHLTSPLGVGVAAALIAVTIGLTTGKHSSTGNKLADGPIPTVTFLPTGDPTDPPTSAVPGHPSRPSPTAPSASGSTGPSAVDSPDPSPTASASPVPHGLPPNCSPGKPCPYPGYAASSAYGPTIVTASEITRSSAKVTWSSGDVAKNHVTGFFVSAVDATARAYEVTKLVSNAFTSTSLSGIPAGRSYLCVQELNSGGLNSGTCSRLIAFGAPTPSPTPSPSPSPSVLPTPTPTPVPTPTTTPTTDPSADPAVTP